jgi:hypothetical protein
LYEAGKQHQERRCWAEAITIFEEAVRTACLPDAVREKAKLRIAQCREAEAAVEQALPTKFDDGTTVFEIGVYDQDEYHAKAFPVGVSTARLEVTVFVTDNASADIGYCKANSDPLLCTRVVVPIQNDEEGYCVGTGVIDLALVGTTLQWHVDGVRQTDVTGLPTGTPLQLVVGGNVDAGMAGHRNEPHIRWVVHDQQARRQKQKEEQEKKRKQQEVKSVELARKKEDSMVSWIEGR